MASKKDDSNTKDQTKMTTSDQPQVDGLDKFKAKDLIEVFQDDEEKQIRGGPLYALVCRKATKKDLEDNDLATEAYASVNFYVVLMEEELHLMNDQFMTLSLRTDGNLLPDTTPSPA